MTGVPCATCGVIRRLGWWARNCCHESEHSARTLGLLCGRAGRESPMNPYHVRHRQALWAAYKEKNGDRIRASQRERYRTDPELRARKSGQARDRYRRLTQGPSRWLDLRT